MYLEPYSIYLRGTIGLDVWGLHQEQHGHRDQVSVWTLCFARALNGFHELRIVFWISGFASGEDEFRP